MIDSRSENRQQVDECDRKGRELFVLDYLNIGYLKCLVKAACYVSFFT